MKFSLMPLRTRLLTLVIGLLIAIATFLIVFFPAQMRDAAESLAKKKAMAMLNLVARASRVAVEFSDDEAARRTLGQLEADDEVLYAILMMPDGERLAEYRRADQSGRRFSPQRLPFVPHVEPVVFMEDDILHTAVLIKSSTDASSRVDTGTPDDTQALPSASSTEGAALFVGISLAPINAQASNNLLTTLLVSLIILIVGISITTFVGGSITRRLGQASVRIANVSSDIYAATQQQEAAGTEHSTSVQEVTQTMQALSESAKHIADSAQEVLANAEKARHTTDETAAKISELSTHANRISEILETIRDIADRSDLLALNASLEATRAGEAGRAFALVAAEMRRLAETVTDSVQVVKGLVADVRGSGAESVVAIEDNRKLVESTTESSRQIRLVTEQQRAVTEQISQNMRDISRVIAQSVSATQQTRTSAEVLTREAEMLAGLVGRSGSKPD